MKKIIILLVVTCFLYPGFSQSDLGVLSEEQLTQDFVIFKSSLTKNHPDLTLYHPQEKFDSLFEVITNSFSDGLSAIQFYQKLTPLLPLIANNHTNIFPPTAYIQYLNREANRFPFSIYYLDKRFYVSEDASTEYILQEGAILKSINGRAVADIFDVMTARITTDGFNKTLPEHYASTGFSRYYAYFLGLPDAFDISYHDRSGKEQQAKISAIPIREIAANRIKRNYQPRITNKENHFEIKNDVGILTIKTFSPASAKELKSLFKTAFKTIKEEAIPNLLIDLRDNIGGYPEASNELLSYLINQPINPTRSEYAITDKIHQEAYFTKDRFFKHFKNQPLRAANGRFDVKGAVDYRLEPQKLRYEGNLVVLINASSSSTTGQLIGLMKSYTKAFFIGEESGGNPVSVVANDILTLVLPNSKVEVKIPLIKSEMNVTFENQGRGMLPDIAVRSTIDDWINDRDTAMEAALKWINEKE